MVSASPCAAPGHAIWLVGEARPHEHIVGRPVDGRTATAPTAAVVAARVIVVTTSPVHQEHGAERDRDQEHVYGRHASQCVGVIESHLVSFAIGSEERVCDFRSFCDGGTAEFEIAAHNGAVSGAATWPTSTSPHGLHAAFTAPTTN